jgi:hypothetical protein
MILNGSTIYYTICHRTQKIIPDRIVDLPATSVCQILHNTVTIQRLNGVSTAYKKRIK